MRVARISQPWLSRCCYHSLEQRERLPRLSRHISVSASKQATPLPHPPAPGPPPKAPTPAASYTDERVVRRKRQAELLKLGQNLRANPSKPSTNLSKRFWNDVSISETDDGLQILLDKRPVRTASKHVLTIPKSKPQLAAAIAIEWDLLVSTQQALKQHYIPLTSLASRAYDIQQADAQQDPKIRDSIVKMLVAYLDTDTLLCWAPEKNIHENFDRRTSENHQTQSLRDLQIQTAQPILDYLTSHIWPGVNIIPSLEPDSILPKSQSESTVTAIKSWVAGLPAYELAGLERGVLATKSLLVGARLVAEWSQELSKAANHDHGQTQTATTRFTIDDAAEASDLEVAWQTKMWGEVEDTHDVNKEDLRRQLGSVVLLVNGSLDEHS